MYHSIKILKKFGLFVFLFTICICIGKAQMVSAATQKRLTVSFYSDSGGRYKTLQKTVAYGDYITVPTVPSGKNSVGLYWKIGKNGKHVNGGTKLKVTSNMHLYRASIRKYYVTLCTTDGKTWKKIVTTGKTKFPSVNLNNGNMVLGWSTAKNKSQNPTYYTDNLIPRKNTTYYMVTYKKTQNKKPASIRKSSKYSKVWFVGDSRTYQLHLALGKSTPSNVKFVYKSGEGLTWFKNTGYHQLITQVRQASIKQKKAVIINLGVNDLKNYSGYVNYMRKIARELSVYGCDMYYMSINPINNAIVKNFGGSRTENQIHNINKEIYSKLCSGSNKCYTYIDTYNYLCKTGWICSARNDGLHYSSETYLRIYDYTIQKIG